MAGIQRLNIILNTQRNLSKKSFIQFCILCEQFKMSTSHAGILKSGKSLRKYLRTKRLKNYSKIKIKDFEQRNI